MNRFGWVMPKRRLRCDDIWDNDGELRDRTNELLNILFPPLEEKDIRFASGMIVGRPGCGKTTSLNTIADRAIRRLGDQVNVVADYGLEEAMGRFNGKPYQLLIVDDPIERTSSRRSMENSDVMARYYRIRHIYKSMSGNDTGCIALIWAPQRLKGLDVFARDIDFLIWKAWPSEEAAQDMVRDLLPPAGVRKLRSITAEAIGQRINDAKSESVVQLTVVGRTGVVKLPMVDRWRLTFPEDDEELLVADDFSLTLPKVLKTLGKDDKWRRKVQIYSDVITGMTQREVADKHNLKSQSSVADAIASLRGEIYRRYGADYEIWKGSALKKAYPHCDVRRLGGQSQPDIILEDVKSGEQRVYACKCLDFTRTTALSPKDIAPELKEARARACRVHLSVYNLSEGREHPETIIDPLRPPERISFSPMS